MSTPLRAGSKAWKVNEYLKSGKSLTKIEAIEQLKEYNLSQRIQDLKNYYEKYRGTHPIMVIREKNTNVGSKRARYFYKGAGCPLEQHPEAEKY